MSILLCIFICIYLIFKELVWYIFNIGTGDNLGGNYNSGSNNPGGGSNPGGGNNPRGGRNYISIHNILNHCSSNTPPSRGNYQTLSPSEMHHILVTKKDAILVSRDLLNIPSKSVSLNDAGYFFPSHHQNPDFYTCSYDKQTLLSLHRYNRDLFKTNPGQTNITTIIKYYKDLM